MNNMTVRRLALLALICFAFLICSCPVSGETMLEAYGMDLDLFLTYLDVDGEEMSIYPIAAGEEENAVLLWGYLPDTTVEEVTLHVSDVNGLYTFSPDEGTDLQVIDAGTGLDGTQLCEITARSEDGETVLIRLFLSLSVSEPVPVQAVEMDSLPDAEPQKAAVQIVVHFVDTEGNRIAPDRTETVWTGQLDAVYADPIDGYIRIGDLAQMVFLPLGTRSAEDVTFVYQPVEPAEISPDDQTENETEESGTDPEPRDPEETVPVEARDHTEPETEPAQAGPEEEDQENTDGMEAEDSRTEEEGLPRDELAEAEGRQTTPVPAPAVKLIQVVYSYENDLYGYSSTRLEPISEGETLLFAEEPKKGYRLEGEDTRLVTVYPDGTADPETVVFTYVRAAETTEEPIAQTTIPVYYQTEDGVNVARPTMETVYAGSQIIYANPADLQDGYDLISGPQEVVYDADGTLTPSQLVFIYRASAEEDVAGTADGKNDFSLQPYSGYARALRTVNLRSYPDQSDSGNIIGTISDDDLIVIRQITNYRNSNWYYVSVNGRMGYVSASVVRELTESETAVLEKNPLEDDSVPEETGDEPGLIERWGKTTVKVRFRTEPGGKLIRELKKNQDIFVLSSEEKDGVLWYAVLAGSQTGWVMADYVELLTSSQSALKQSQVKTPAPTHTPQMTRVPTATPTIFIPTPSPDPEEQMKTPEPTGTPVPYFGYGLSVTRAAVRSSLDLNDDSVREMIAVDTLVSIQGQTYVDGVCWDSVRVVSSGVTGFTQDSQLRRISDSEADYYIASLSTPTPAPVILSTPEPFSGMARTLGNYVPLRTDMSPNAQIIELLTKDSILQVYAQETSVSGVTWCLAQYGQDIGYVRRDMIVQMNDWEIAGYIASLRTPTPTPLATPVPAAVSQRATAYGIVNRDRVNLRQEPSVTSLSLYMMTRNEMGYILETVEGEDGKNWYYLTISGRAGYICSDYLTILTQNELDDFLNTEDFRSANASENLIHDSSSLFSYEDHLQEQWQSASASASFEPFNPYETPAPAAAVTNQPAATPTLPPTVAPTIVGGLIRDDGESAREAPDGLSLGVIALAAGGAVILAGGTVIYLRGSRRRKQKRQALRRAQMAQSAQRARRMGSESYEQDLPEMYHQDRPSMTAADSYRRPEASRAAYRSGNGEEEMDRTRRSDPVPRYRTERQTSPYRQDGEASFRGTRRTVRVERDESMTAENEDTAMFRKPVRPAAMNAAEPEENGYFPDEPEVPEQPVNPGPEEELTGVSSGRRRRAQRYRDDQ